MEKELFKALWPSIGEISDNLTSRERDGSVWQQTMDFIVKAVEERIERMSQGEGQ